MKVLCMYPGEYGRNIAKILGLPIRSNWAIVGNPLNEETRRMYVLAPFGDSLFIADVPISRIRILTEDEASAIKLCTDSFAKEALVLSIREDTKQVLTS